MIRILNFHVVGLYRKNQIGVNCLDNEIIVKESTCKVASAVLGLKFSNSRTNHDAPAGCYWRFEGFSYFNKITDATKTNPDEFLHKGGVCINVGKYFISQ